ncbi:hypothetical protein ACHAWF_012249 [Thalassiosira exigua]
MMTNRRNASGVPACYYCDAILVIVAAVALMATCSAFQPTIWRYRRVLNCPLNRNDDTDASLTQRFSSNKESEERDADEEIFPDDATEITSPPIRKFTGASYSPSLFSQPQEESFSTNLQREKEREFNLAGNFERTLPLQAGVLLASFGFILSVGISGGITDGSDRYFGGDDDVDELLMQQQLYGRITDDASEAEDMMRQRDNIVRREIIEVKGRKLGASELIDVRPSVENQWM